MCLWEKMIETLFMDDIFFYRSDGTFANPWNWSLTYLSERACIQCLKRGGYLLTLEKFFWFSLSVEGPRAQLHPTPRAVAGAVQRGRIPQDQGPHQDGENSRVWAQIATTAAECTLYQENTKAISHSNQCRGMRLFFLFHHFLSCQGSKSAGPPGFYTPALD